MFDIYEAVKKLKANKFIPDDQKNYIAHILMDGEEKEYYADIINKLDEVVKNAPNMYETDGQEDKKPVLHYFYGNYDAYAYELDKQSGEMFGHVSMGYEYELGYFSMEEINSVPQIELDLYFDGALPKELIRENVNEKVEETNNYKRTRLEEPSTCVRGSFRTKQVNDKGDKIILCKDKETGKFKAQSKLKKKHEILESEHSYRVRAYDDYLTNIKVYDPFIDYVDLYKTSNENIFDVEFVAKGESNNSLPIYIAKGVIDLKLNQWVKYPEIKENITKLKDKEISNFIINSWNKFIDERKDNINTIVKDIIQNKSNLYEDIDTLCDKVDNANKQLKDLIKAINNPLQEASDPKQRIKNLQVEESLGTLVPR